MFENQKDIRFDDDLQLEAYIFNGVVQAFPNHFHEYFVIGLIEAGERRLTVNNREYCIGPGDLISFNPMENHACEQKSGTLRYRCLNIKQEIMQGIARELFESDELPYFKEPVQHNTALAPSFGALHESIMHNGAELEKEELFLLFMEQLLSYAGRANPSAQRKEIEALCTFLEQHYAERITLNMLSELVQLNKYYLVRLFTRHKGITPYRYLETIRINKAKTMLEQGIEPAQAAQLVGFSDQSHFSTYFGKFIGLTPGQYQAIFREVAK
ncbi:MAG: AraC family transcriptional regulator [Deferribacteraceae bacterium]|jgi:AraC-like DNA-binding protein|nr:AraC family transcriptional regulator [Deferribacteraceae bacterium]